MISYLKYSHISCFATVFYLSKFEYGYIGAMNFTLSLIFLMPQKWSKSKILSWILSKK